MPVKQVPTLGWTRGSAAATIALVTRAQKEHIAREVRAAMEQQGLTNAALAFRAHVSEKTISRLINAQKEPRYDTIDRVAVALGMTERELRGMQRSDGGGEPPAPSQLDRIEAQLDQVLLSQAEAARTDAEVLKQIEALRRAMPGSQ